MNFLVNTIDDLSTVVEPTTLSSKNFMLLSKIDTYNGESEPTYQIYRISDKVLLRGYKPTLVERNLLLSEISKISDDFNQISVTLQKRNNYGNTNRGGMEDEVSGYMKVSEVANGVARMMPSEEMDDIIEKFVEQSELSAVASELWATGDEYAHDLLDYAGALAMALITAHGTALQAQEEPEEEEEEKKD